MQILFWRSGVGHEILYFQLSSQAVLLHTLSTKHLVGFWKNEIQDASSAELLGILIFFFFFFFPKLQKQWVFGNCQESFQYMSRKPINILSEIWNLSPFPFPLPSSGLHYVTWAIIRVPNLSPYLWSFFLVCMASLTCCTFPPNYHSQYQICWCLMQKSLSLGSHYLKHRVQIS